MAKLSGWMIAGIVLAVLIIASVGTFFLSRNFRTWVTDWWQDLTIKDADIDFTANGAKVEEKAA